MSYTSLVSRYACENVYGESAQLISFHFFLTFARATPSLLTSCAYRFMCICENVVSDLDGNAHTYIGSPSKFYTLTHTQTYGAVNGKTLSGADIAKVKANYLSSSWQTLVCIRCDSRFFLLFFHVVQISFAVFFFFHCIQCRRSLNDLSPLLSIICCRTGMRLCALLAIRFIIIMILSDVVELPYTFFFCFHSNWSSFIFTILNSTAWQ